MPTKSKPKVKKKLKMKDPKTGLRIGPDSNLIVESEKEAKILVEKAGEASEEINRIRLENNLPSLEADYESYRKLLRDYQKENNVLEISSGNFVSSLIDRTKSFWVWSDTDIPENIVLIDEVVPLRAVIKRKFRDMKQRAKITEKITRRVVQAAELDDIVKAGILTAEDVEESLAQYVETSYVQVKEKKK